MKNYTQESYQKDRDLQEELKGYKDSRKFEDREQRDTYWDAYYRADAFLAGGQAAEAVKHNSIMNDRFLPWSGNHLDDNLAIFAGALVANGVGRFLLDTNQSTAFGKQLAGFAKAGWLITGVEEVDCNEFGVPAKKTYLVLQHVA